MDPATQEHQLTSAGVALANIYRDVGVSGKTVTAVRPGWRLLNDRLAADDVLVVAAVDRVGRQYLDVLTSVLELRRRGVRIRSLASAETEWTQYLDPDPDNAIENLMGNLILNVWAYTTEKALDDLRSRTKAGLERARAQGKRLGRPPAIDAEMLERAVLWRRRGHTYTEIAAALRVARSTVRERLEALGIQQG